jgi:hypothetical protein
MVVRAGGCAQALSLRINRLDGSKAIVRLERIQLRKPYLP